MGERVIGCRVIKLPTFEADHEFYCIPYSILVDIDLHLPWHTHSSQYTHLAQWSTMRITHELRTHTCALSWHQRTGNPFFCSKLQNEDPFPPSAMSLFLGLRFRHFSQGVNKRCVPFPCL